MPLYEYQCPACHKSEDHFRTMDERNNAPLHCGKPMERQIAPAYGYVVGAAYNYRTVAADKKTGKKERITSKRQHEEFLKRNNYEPTA